MTRLQETAVERLALVHGRVAVRDYADRVTATAPSGREFRIAEDGVAHDAGVDFSVDWGQS